MFLSAQRDEVIEKCWESNKIRARGESLSVWLSSPPAIWPGETVGTAVAVRWQGIHGAPCPAKP